MPVSSNQSNMSVSNQNPTNNNEYQDLLRHVMKVPTNRCIIRQNFLYNICSRLQDIDQCGGHIWVHGKRGSGKTVAVSQAVRIVVEQKKAFHPNGVYWITIGNAKNQRLFLILEKLCLELGLQGIDLPQKLDDVVDRLNRYFQGS
ncbi:uncharacterized protein TRIADDRAFT_60836 [Trichoplax adhaerens]|uniref:NB-ARC domain-containing protein n=1 Tax=Trichoplax adhaerens TaxID=10228 RepID=B3S9A7_TRIAD|nr:predicted protein [Trichoplax adhaerens]EDV20671.1 predicted protein [Trichoplax adhaerens]|eukprot:XP_002116871.1 predicted protein [Trichoplax adhaerens]